MAKRGALTHRKTRRLARLLDMPVPCALGMMEALWCVAGAHTPDGAIGSISNQDIAEEMFWDGPADAMIQAFVDAGLLDEHPEHRLVVHDWSDHCDDTVRKRLAYQKRAFCDGSSSESRKTAESRACSPEVLGDSQRNSANVESFAPLPKPKPLAISHKPEPVPDTLGAATLSAESAPPAPPRMRVTVYEPDIEPQPPPGPEERPPPAAKRRRKHDEDIPADVADAWSALRDAYPPRNGGLGLADGLKAFTRLARDGLNLDAIVEGARRYAAWAEASDTAGTRYVKCIPTWLNGKCWQERWDPPERSAKSRNGRTAAPPRETMAQEAERLAREARELRNGQNGWLGGGGLAIAHDAGADAR